MANREKGEVDIPIGDKTYTLVLNTNAIVTLETLLSTPEKEVAFNDVLDAMSRASRTYTRAFVWACLRKYHGAVTIEQAGELIDEVGPDAFVAAVLQIKRSAVPDKEDTVTLAKTDRPQKPRRVRGTGAAATSTHAASA